MELEKILKISAIFLIGILTANIINFFLVYGLEIPLNLTSSGDRAPSDFVKEGEIEIFKDKVVIHVENPSMSRYAPTGSMRPLLDQGANGIRIRPSSEKCIEL
jgi:hypothetical protein